MGALLAIVFPQPTFEKFIFSELFSVQSDIFDFWMVPSADPMPPLQELMQNVRNGFNLTVYTQAIRNIAENDVRVTYITELRLLVLSLSLFLSLCDFS